MPEIDMPVARKLFLKMFFLDVENPPPAPTNL
jgi:hypothetical protein